MNTINLLNPEPGIYEDLDFADYRRIQAVNKSILDHIEDACPAVCQWRMTHPEDETDALKIGHAFHTLTLEGKEVFDAAYVVASQCNGIKKSDGKRCENDGKIENAGLFFCGQHAPKDAAASGKTVLTASQFTIVQGMRNGILSIEECRMFIGSEGKNELTIVWRDEETGLLCKARIDMHRPTWDGIGDLKTTMHAGPRDDQFPRSIKDYGYHRQAAFYLDGCKAVGLPAKSFMVFPVEKEAPFVANAYQVSTETVELGRDQIRRNLKVFAACTASGHWPGYASDFPLISVPAYEMRKEMRLVGAL